jgi:hypothetical protein
MFGDEPLLTMPIKAGSFDKWCRRSLLASLANCRCRLNIYDLKLSNFMFLSLGSRQEIDSCSNGYFDSMGSWYHDKSWSVQQFFGEWDNAIAWVNDCWKSGPGRHSQSPFREEPSVT